MCGRCVPHSIPVSANYLHVANLCSTRFTTTAVTPRMMDRSQSAIQHAKSSQAAAHPQTPRPQQLASPQQLQPHLSPARLSTPTATTPALAPIIERDCAAPQLEQAVPAVSVHASPTPAADGAVAPHVHLQPASSRDASPEQPRFAATCPSRTGVLAHALVRSIRRALGRARQRPRALGVA